MDEIPDEVYEDEQYVEIPHKNELDLGKELVLEFAAGHMPDELDKIQSLFRRKGAYSKYKDWLERNGLLDEWYLFEEKRQEEALRQWCEENDIIIED